MQLATKDILADDEGKFEHFLTDLFPNTRYTITVSPVNGAGSGLTSRITIYTQNGEQVCFF